MPFLRACDTSVCMPQRTDQPWTVLGLLKWTTQYLEGSGVESPRLGAEVLLAHCLRSQRIDLYTRFEYRPTGDELRSYRRLVERASKHEPVAYLIGQKEFYSLTFKVTPDVLIPRPETELLVAEAIEHLRTRTGSSSMWDVCTGSGCVAIAVGSQVENVTILATDVSPQVLSVARENARTHRLTERITFRQADLLTSPPESDQITAFDVITANPPYVAQGDEVGPEVAYEPQEALMGGEDGLEFIRPIIAAAPRFLKPGAVLVLEFGHGQADTIRELIVASGAFAEPRILRDHQQIERVAVATTHP